METRSVRVIEKYLQQHAEDEARLPLDVQGAWDRVLVIPAFDETDLLFVTLASIYKMATSTLTVLVVNGRQEAPDSAHKNNAQVLSSLRDQTSAMLELSQGPPLHLIPKGKDAILLVDRASPGHRLTAKEGVGKARRIGADLALKMILEGKIKHPIIHNTDADVRVPMSFVDVTHRPGVSAWISPFRHEVLADPSSAEAMRRYELTIRLHVLGLRHAKSPYAFQNIGSTMAVAPLSYAQVRGFPDRQAAEDFYLLNKLAKVGSIDVLSGSPLIIAGRSSERVPFGTGMAVKKQLDANGEAPHLAYHPGMYPLVGATIDAISLAATAAHWPNIQDALAMGLEKAGRELSEDDKELLLTIWELRGLWPRLEKALAQHQRPKKRWVQAHILFDAFATLRLVHDLRERRFPSMPVGEATGHMASLLERECPSGDLASLLEEVIQWEESAHPTQAGLRI